MAQRQNYTLLKYLSVSTEIKKQEHIDHIANVVKEKEKVMFEVADKINAKTASKTEPQGIIDTKKKENEDILKRIQKSSLEMEEILKEIGELTNEKNDVEKRKTLQNELDQIPIKIQNEELHCRHEFLSSLYTSG